MKAVIEQITVTINQEVECLRGLLDIVQAERKALLERQPERLTSLAERKIGMCRELGIMQEHRRELMRQVAGNGPAPAKLSDLTQHLDPAERAPFKQAVSRVRQLAASLNRINSLNRVHVEEALDTVEHVLSILTGQSGNDGYLNRGQLPVRQAPRMLARQV
jgi:flagellar biosynthesis/type III secretory pathway chaperone